MTLPCMGGLTLICKSCGVTPGRLRELLVAWGLYGADDSLNNEGFSTYPQLPFSLKRATLRSASNPCDCWLSATKIINKKLNNCQTRQWMRLD